MATFWKRPPKEEGISCVVRVKNEADWVRLSLLSILDFADEIVCVDNGSTDGTLELVRGLKDDLGIEKLKIFTFPPIDGKKIKTHMLYNFSFGQATKTWLCKWDADFIARTDQKYSIMELKELWGEYKHRMDVLRTGGPNLFFDHRHWFHEPPDNLEFWFERFLFRNRKWKHRMEDRYENLVLKAHRRCMRIGPAANDEDRRVYFFHLKGLKPDEHICFRHTLSDWWKYCQTHPNPELTYEEFLADFWGTADKEEQKRRCLSIYFEDEKLKVYERIGGDWGEYPTLLKPYMERPKYEVVYKDGRPADRITRPDREVPLPENFRP